MRNMLKAEFKKLFKGKIIYILMASGIGFSLLTGLLYNQIAGFYDEIEMKINVIEIFSQSFTPLNNFGIMLIIFIMVIATADFSQKTIRTKLVGGYSRTKIYLVSLIKIFTVAIISMLVHLLSSYIFLSLFIETTNEPIEDYFNVLVIGLSSILVLYAIVNLFTFRFGKFGATLGLTMAVIIVPTIIQTILLFTTENKTFLDIMRYIFPISSLTGIQVLDTNEFIITLLVNIGMISAISFLGIFINNKIDYI